MGGGRDVRATEDSEGLTEREGTRWGRTRLKAAPPFLRHVDSRNAGNFDKGTLVKLEKERVQLLHRASITLTLVASTSVRGNTTSPTVRPQPHLQLRRRPL